MTPTRHLFVYGSLLSAIGHPNSKRLAREARLVGTASMQGQLYAIDWYPGAVEPDFDASPDGAASAAGTAETTRTDSPAPNDLHDVIWSGIRGEVYLLSDPESSLAWLDAYEGIDAGSGPPGEFFSRHSPRQTGRWP